MSAVTAVALFPLGCLLPLAAFLYPVELLKTVNFLSHRLEKVPWDQYWQQCTTFAAALLWQAGVATVFCLTQLKDFFIFVKNLQWTKDQSIHRIQAIEKLAGYHETAAVLADLIQKDGAGSWPPRANFQETSWPKPFRPYHHILLEMTSLLAQSKASLDDECNRLLITNFRTRFRHLLQARIDLEDVRRLLEAADAGRWDVFPREALNALYCCIAMCRHAYRWGTIPVVKVAQLEQVVDLPAELVEPWKCLQRLFGCTSESGNNTSCLVLNCDDKGHEIYQINAALGGRFKSSEEAFVQILHEVEVLGLPIYHDMILAILSFSRDDKIACAGHLARINSQLRPLFSSYYTKAHDNVIALSVWLSHVQGFFAWGAGHFDEYGTWVKFDGLSGNQSLLFQSLDAFLGLEPYLSPEDMERNVPLRQRRVCDVFRKHSFRHMVSELERDASVVAILTEFEEIVKRLRLFRTAHRTRALKYLSSPAPERLPMTAGKSLLKSDMEQSLEFLDGFMVQRLKQTI